MTKKTLDDAAEPEDLTDDPDAYDAPPELAETVVDGGDSEPASRPPRSAALKLAGVVALVLLIGGGLLAYRGHHRRKVLAEGLAKADALLRLDTAAGYREAASLLEPLAGMDPSEAASVRAFALAMLFADYRAADLETEAEALLVKPERADVVPAHAHLASAALAMGRREAGTATTAAARAGEGAWARAIQARIAFLAGNAAAALEPAAAAASEGAFAPGLALHGDALRRLRKDPAGARAAYEAALAASPYQPRAAYGLAKLALAGHASGGGAIAALDRLVADGAGTPGPERGRAALHLAALRLRAGDRAAADAALDASGLEAPARSWAARAAEVAAENRGPYRAVAGAPASLQSASDDDSAELSPAPPPPPAQKPVVKPVAKVAPKAVAKAAPKAVAKAAAKAVAKAPPKGKKATAMKAAAAAKTPAKQTATKKTASSAKKAPTPKKSTAATKKPATRTLR